MSLSLCSRSSRLRSGAIFICCMAARFICWSGPTARAGDDPALDYGIVDGYPEILWLKDYGDLTGCCLTFAGVPNSPYMREQMIKLRVKAILNNRDFVYVFSSGYSGWVSATSGGGAASPTGASVA